MRLFKRIFYFLSGGRPMKRIGFAFVEKVSGHSVYYYRDRWANRLYLAIGPWDNFRILVEK